LEVDVDVDVDAPSRLDKKMYFLGNSTPQNDVPDDIS